MKKSTKLALAITAIVIGCQPLPWHTPDVLAATSLPDTQQSAKNAAAAPKGSTANVSQQQTIAAAVQSNPVPNASPSPGGPLPDGFIYNDRAGWQVKSSSTVVTVTTGFIGVTGSAYPYIKETYTLNLSTGLINYTETGYASKNGGAGVVMGSFTYSSKSNSSNFDLVAYWDTFNNYIVNLVSIGVTNTAPTGATPNSKANASLKQILSVLTKFKTTIPPLPS